MKENYKELRCPHCGAKDVEILTDDVFQCEYCNQKFSFDIQDIEQDNSNSVIIEGLKEKFYKELATINEQKRVNYDYLLYYIKLANPKKFLTVSLIVFVSMFVLSVATMSIISETPAPTIVFFLASVAAALLCVIAKIRKNKMNKRYRRFVAHFATEVADCDNKISVYSKLISKLTK